MDKLKPCPFCGGEAVLTQLTAVYNSGRGSLTTDFYVNCTECEVRTTQYESEVYISASGDVVVDADGAQTAVEAWNRRTSDE